MTRDGNTTTTLFEQLHDTDAPTWAWTLLGFDAGVDGEHDPRLRTALAVAATRHPWLRPRLVRHHPDGTGDTRGATDGIDADPTPSLWDLDGQAHSAYGVTRTATLTLIRPDGHIALLAPADRVHALLDYCDRIVAPTPAQPDDQPLDLVTMNTTA